jgi:signal transduction histidine kinase
LNLSSSFYEAKDYSATLSWAKKGYDYYKQADKPEDLGYALQVYVDVYIARKQIDSALFYLNEIKKLNATYPNEYLVTVNLAQRGEVYHLEGKYDSAIVMYNKCVQFYEDAELADAVLHTRLNLSRAYMALNKLDVARKHAMDAFVRSEAIRNKIMVVKSSALLADVLRAQREFEKALHYSQIGTAYKDSIMAQSLKGSIEGRFFDVKLENETREKMAAITTLQMQDALIGRQWTVIILVTIGLVAMIVVAYFIRRAGRYRKRMNDQLTISNKRLSEMNDEINGLVNTIVHDLKSPLSNVQGILSVLELTAGNNAETKSLVAMANKSIANGHDIIRQLLELRELEENRAEVNLSLIDTKEFITDICESFSHSAKQKDIALRISADAHPFTSDKILIRRVMDNLVSNALKFSSTGSEVKISAFRENGNIVFSVSDQGPGFSNEDLRKVYGKFQKLSARPTGGENSNGLGLATVQALTRYLNGSIDLDTEFGTGSTFTLKVPDVKK